MQTAEDAVLLDAWCSGDRDAGDRLLRRSFPVLYRFLFNKVGDHAGDLVQQTMLACLENRESLAQCTSFQAWMLRVARNLLYDYLKRCARDPADLHAELPSVRDLGTSAASLLGRAADELEILSALRQLPVDLQVILELHYWNELSTREIADVVDIPVGTVKSRLRRAREAIERVLGDGVSLSARVRAARP